MPARRSRWIFLLIVFLLSFLGLLLSLMIPKAPGVFQSPWIAAVERSSPQAEASAHSPRLFEDLGISSDIIFCIAASNERIDLVGRVVQPDRTLYLLAGYRDFTNRNPLIQMAVRDELIVRHSGHPTWCERLLPASGARLQPLNAVVPSAVVLELERQRYRRWMAQLGGKARFRAALVQQIQENRGSYLLSDEQVQALHELGVTVSGYRRFTRSTFSSSGG